MINAFSAPHTGSTPDSDRSIYIGLLILLSGLLVLPLPSAAQTTQTLSLEEGWNLVSLRVQPDDPSFVSIFGGTDGAISSVKNEDGAAYLPALGIEQISTWRADEGYKVHAETATTIKIIGTELSPGSVAIALEEGGNIVPYLPHRAQAVEEAVMSIEESLIAVENEDGRRYPSGSTPLDSLRPDQGYKVYVDRADTLRYPIVARTLDDALALTGVPDSSYVRVQGYHGPGDGGGGLFRVTDSGAETDGGTVFVFDDDVSNQKSYTTPDNGDGLGEDDFVGNTDLVWGTVSVQYGDTEAESIGTEFLHGHNTESSPVAAFDLKGGLPTGTTDFWDLCRWHNGDPDGPYTVRYRHATSDRRLERIAVTNAVSIDWWGAKEADPQNPVNNWWRINWAINKAAEIYQNKNIDWAYVDIPGEYYYRYSIRIREGIKLRGATNRYERVPTKTFGEAANNQATYGKLTIMPGMAMNHQKNGWKDTHVHHPLRVAAIDLTHDYMANKVGMEALEVDGNVAENLAPIEDSNDEYSDIQNKLQNGNNWNGFASKAVNAWATPNGAVADFDDVYIHDFPGNGIGVNNALDFSPSKNVRVGNASRNHQLYRTNGLHDGWTIEGAGWASLLKVTKGNFQNVTINPSPNPLNEYWGTTWFKVFDHHGKGFGADWFAEEDFRKDLNIAVDGFSVDLTNEPREHVGVIMDRGYGGSYRNGTVLSAPTKGTTLIKPVSTDGNGPIRDYVYQDIQITDQGGGVSLWKGGPSTHNEVRNVTIQSAPDVAYSTRGLIGIEMAEPTVFAEKDQGSDVPLAMAARLDVSGLDVQETQKHTIVAPQGSGQMPYDLFMVDSFIENALENVPAGERSRGILFGGGPAHFRLYLDNTTFNVWSARPSYRPDGFHKYVLSDEQRIRLRNSQDQTGRVSDASGTYTSEASDEGNDYVLIPTSLMSLAQETDVSVTSGNRSVTSVQNANSEGTVLTWDPDNPQEFDPRDPHLKVALDGPIQSGETITLDWAARVTPLSDYQTTGLFVARPVENKSVALGSGPLTVDLRGTMASQESKEPIEYTASSGNASIVSATVNAVTGPSGNAVGWKLELTEQSAGTATITVTGEISGVGTAQTTFEVTVE